MTKLVLILFLIAPGLAQADLSGAWTGTPTATDGRGLTLPCRLEMTVSQTPSELKIPNHELHCGFMDKTWAGPFKLSIVNGRLIFSQDSVAGDIGSINDHELHAAIKSCDGSRCSSDSTITYDLVLKADGTLVYEENWITLADGVSHLKISGTLTR